MKIGDTLPPLPRRGSTQRIRNDQALNAFFPNSDQMHRAKFDDVSAQAWFDYSRLTVRPKSVRKRSEGVELVNESTYQRSI